MRTLPLIVFATLVCAPATNADEATFREKIAPILERRCVACHSETTPKGKLSLATLASFRKGGESGHVVEPGQPDDSLLIEKITGKKPEMPKTGQPLSPGEIDTIRGWIKSGADWPEGFVLNDRKFDGELWWSLQPLKSPKIPTPKIFGKIHTSVDAFILDSLEKKGLSPSSEADRRTLIRRLTFDLTGLPPTSVDVNLFINDRRTDAYERLVDRLLASPAYGERWARHWLDLAHYGDTHGYDKDKRRDNAWPYRDYVIEAFNRDLSYTRFVQEQLAGDVMFPQEPRGVVATGFIAAGPWDFVGHAELREGTVDKEKTRLLDRDDMVTTAMSTFTSLTVHCARCHDHKFDPIPQRDYYRLQAVFAGVDRGDRPYDDASIRARLAQIDSRISTAKARREHEIAKITDLGVRTDVLAILAPSSTVSPSNGYHSNIEATADKIKWVQVDLGRSLVLDQIRLIPARPTDFADTPGFGFPERFRVETADEPMFQKPNVILDQQGSFANPGDQPLTLVVRDKSPVRYIRVTATRLWMRTNDYIFALGELQAFSGKFNAARGTAVTSLDSIESGRWSNRSLVDGYDSRKSIGSTDENVSDSQIRRLLEKTAGATETERFIVRLAQIDREISNAEHERQSVPQPLKVYAVVPRAPRSITILKRGEVEQPGGVVQPGALSCVSGLPSEFTIGSADEGNRRIALAQWVTNPGNPLTWRSIVNRVWHYHFGRGIVDTPSDFGHNGSKPTHPELLDWLAANFRDSGGSFKTLHRLIVTSATYRQTSGDRADAVAVDTDNRLLWRMNRSRLDAEEIRDAILLVAGTLDPARGGPGFQPFRFKDDHSPIYDHEDISRSLATDCRRRSIYRFTVRSVPHPFLDCMDAADPNINVPVRSLTITALQALALWNDPFVLTQAEALAKHVADDKPEEQVRRAVMAVLGRPPGNDELQLLMKLAKQRGMKIVCRLLFNTNEFLFID